MTTRRILALGINGLPNQIQTIDWKSVINGEPINISDYEIVFIDFSYFIKNADEEKQIHRCLNETKFYEVMKSGIHLYIFGIAGYHSSGIRNEKKYLYSWLPDILNIKPTREAGEVIRCLDKKFSEYFSFLKSWNCHFDIEQKIMRDHPYLYDVKELAINNAGKRLGFKITNFREIDILNYQVHRQESGVKKFDGEVNILPTLGEDSAKGVISILKNEHGFTFSRQEPVWVSNIQTKKSSIIHAEAKELFKEKERIESEISKKFNLVEEIEYFKSLLWETGPQLEKVVYDSLKLIGVTTSKPTKADEDGITQYKNKEYVLEVKSGLERGAEWTELSKLIARMNTRNKTTGNMCNGLFIMNHYANHSPDKRDKPFPNNVVDTAKVNNVKLITTVQLFDIVRGLLDDENNQDDAQKKLFS